MSLFSSLKLIKDVSQSRTPTSRVDIDALAISSSIKFLSPRPISEEVKTFEFRISKHLLKRKGSNDSAQYLAP